MDNFAEKSVKELINDLKNEIEALSLLRLKKSLKKLDRGHLYSLQKKKVARIKTFLKQKTCNCENK